MTWLAAVAAVALWLGSARSFYQRFRPSKVPLCGREAGSRHRIDGDWETPAGHFYSCFKRLGPVTSSDGVKHNYEAAWLALFLGAIMPMYVLGYAIYLAVAWKPRETDAEREKRLDSRPDLRKGRLE